MMMFKIMYVSHELIWLCSHESAFTQEEIQNISADALTHGSKEEACVAVPPDNDESLGETAENVLEPKQITSSLKIPNVEVGINPVQATDENCSEIDGQTEAVDADSVKDVLGDPPHDLVYIEEENGDATLQSSEPSKDKVSNLKSTSGIQAASDGSEAEQAGKDIEDALSDEEQEVSYDLSDAELESHSDGEVIESCEVAQNPQLIYDRAELMLHYQAQLEEASKLRETNYQLQHKLAEYLRRKKTDDALAKQDHDPKNVTDQEERYHKYMANLQALIREKTAMKEMYTGQIDEQRMKCQSKLQQVQQETDTFLKVKEDVSTKSYSSRTGRIFSPKDVEQFMQREAQKETEVTTMRLDNIQLKNKLKKQEQLLREKEELADGLHLIDFEQLKIENQTYNEKIEERNEELMKLRKKITNTVQVLTHIKEKLQHMQVENEQQNCKLQEADAEVTQRRDTLNHSKQVRDNLRTANQRLQQQCGMLGNEALLFDYEERKEEAEQLHDKLSALKRDHAAMILNCNKLRRKIEGAEHLDE
ncbi:PREDICTED: coiled-coil domain-containing protein 96-like [Priapulus caudatus]|uniref:Coiled-coil domain-containing protein 96-like n=1 Tax=Priapulus caudatus TaxID=37621 RepID=A0ABM1E2N6_PRICU|nr:PREDICTED: coiled-coil domain-containing protein 96-like [Priapulus caudatus]